MFTSVLLFVTTLFTLLGCTAAFGLLPRGPMVTTLISKELLKSPVKNIAAGVLGVAVATVGSSELSPASSIPSVVAVANAAVDNAVFVGEYSDPFHPGCMRKISIVDGKVTLTGSDSTDGSKQWVLQAKTPGDGSILVDFSPKGGPADLKGKFVTSTNSIQWPDGNSWTKK